jgi:hypothetical protein
VSFVVHELVTVLVGHVKKRRSTTRELQVTCKTDRHQRLYSFVFLVLCAFLSASDPRRRHAELRFAVVARHSMRPSLA